MAVSWSRFEADSSDLARKVKARFEAHRHHILGTLRSSGAPRLSGTEVEIDDEVRIGVMADSHKLADLRRDGRAELHSAPLEENLVGGDARIAGRLVEDGHVEDLDGYYFRYEIERVVLVQVAGDELVVTSWTEEGGTREKRRK